VQRNRGYRVGGLGTRGIIACKDDLTAGVLCRGEREWEREEGGLKNGGGNTNEVRFRKLSRSGSGENPASIRGSCLRERGVCTSWGGEFTRMAGRIRGCRPVNRNVDQYGDKALFWNQAAVWLQQSKGRQKKIGEGGVGGFSTGRRGGFWDGRSQ